MNTDTITILTCGRQNLATKRFDAEGNSQPVNIGMYFDVEHCEVTDLSSLSHVLKNLEPQRTKFVIRGQLRDGIEPKHVRRKSVGFEASFTPVDHQWLCVDIDDLPLPEHLSDFNQRTNELIGYVCDLLPPEFHGVDCYWQFSSSMGIKPGVRVHLWFWLDQPISDADAKAWLYTSSVAVDAALYRTVQPHYTAAPLFADPVHNLVKTRSGMLMRDRDQSSVPVPADLQERVINRPPRKMVRTVSGNHVLDPQEVVRDEQGRVIDGRELFLFLKSTDAAGELTTGKRKPSVEELTDLIWLKFKKEADLADGKWTKADAREKALARLVDLEEGRAFTARSDAHVLIPGFEPSFEMTPVSLDEGVTRLGQNLDNFFSAAIRGQGVTQVERVTMGVGKTSLTIEKLEAAFLKKPDLNVAVYVPRHDLIQSDFVPKLEAWCKSRLVDLRHIRGMVDTDVSDSSLCRRPAYVSGLSRHGLSVRSNACYRDQNRKCEFYDECPYWAQFDRHDGVVVGSVRLYAHANLKYPRHESEPEPDIVIVDEGFVGSLHEERRLSLEDVRVGLLDVEPSFAGDRMADAIRDGEPLLNVLRELGSGDCWSRSAESRLSPTEVPFIGAGDRVPASLGDGRIRGARLALLEVIGEEIKFQAREHAERVRYDRRTNEVVIDQLFPMQIPRSASLLVLDATADESLVRHVLRGRAALTFNRIDVNQNAIVTQVYDRTGSNKSWDDDWTTENRALISELITLMTEYAYYGANVVCVSHKALADRLREEGLHERIKIAHFGGLRGSNEFEHGDVIFVTGRNQPPQSAVDGLARAIFWNDEMPLHHDEAAGFDAPAGVDLAEDVRGYLTSDAADSAGIKIRSFSDARIEALQQQMREAETIQAISRLRLVRAPQPKHVILLSNLPIEISVDRLVKFKQLMPDWAERELMERGSIPLSAKGLEVMFPDRFKSKSAATDAIRRSRLRLPSELTQMSPVLARYGMFVVQFRRAKVGDPVGRVFEHLFRVKPDDEFPHEFAMLSWDHCKSVLEKGYPDAPGSGWEEVVYVDCYWLRQ